MVSLWVFYIAAGVSEILGNYISSPQIRILDAVERRFETGVLAHRFERRTPNHLDNFKPKGLRQEPNDQNLKSFVIYNDYPFKIFKEWKGKSESGQYKDLDHYESRIPNELILQRQPHQSRSRDPVFDKNPRSAYQSIYSSVIRVFENSRDGDNHKWNFQPNTNPQPYFKEQKLYMMHPSFPKYHSKNSFQKPGNFEFPQIFAPNSFGISSFPVTYHQPAPFAGNGAGFNPVRDKSQDGTKSNGNKNTKNHKRMVLCGYIRLNNRTFPNEENPCLKGEDEILLPEYYNYSDLTNDKLPMEHRRQQIQSKKLKRSIKPDLQLKRPKRNSSFGYESWDSPFSYSETSNNYFTDFFSQQNAKSDYDNNNYQNSNDQFNRNKNNNDGQWGFNSYFDSYQATDNSKSKGLANYLMNGGRRYKKRYNDNGNDNNDDYSNNNDNDGNNDSGNGNDNSNDNSENNDYNDDNNNSDYDANENGDNRNDRGNNRRSNDNSRNRRRNNQNYNDYDDDNNNYSNNNNNNYNNRRNNRNRQNNNNNNNNRRNNYNRNRNGYRNNNDNNGYGNNNGYNNNNNGYSSYGGNRGYNNDNGYGNSRNYGGSSYGNYGNNGYNNDNDYGNSRNGGSSYGSYGNNGYGNNNDYGSSRNGGSSYGSYGNNGYSNNNDYGSSRNGGSSYGSYGNNGYSNNNDYGNSRNYGGSSYGNYGNNGYNSGGYGGYSSGGYGGGFGFYRK